MRSPEVVGRGQDGAQAKEVPGGELTTTQRTVNRALVASREPVERGSARLKTWQILR